MRKRCWMKASKAGRRGSWGRARARDSGALSACPNNRGKGMFQSIPGIGVMPPKWSWEEYRRHFLTESEGGENDRFSHLQIVLRLRRQGDGDSSRPGPATTLCTRFLFYDRKPDDTALCKAVDDSALADAGVVCRRIRLH